MTDMATQIMSDAERDKLQAFPQISREELVRYFTLTPADEGFLAAHRRPANRLGLAVQLCTLPWLGFVPDNVASAPAPAVARLAEHLGVAAEVLSSYGRHRLVAKPCPSSRLGGGRIVPEPLVLRRLRRLRPGGHMGRQAVVGALVGRRRPRQRDRAVLRIDHLLFDGGPGR
jgi:hypothetical protein